jgi:hypothetical protein
MIRSFMKRPPWAAATLGLVILAGSKAPSRARAAEPPPKAALGKADHSACLDLLLYYLERRRAPEFVQMVWAVATGSRMGPGEGWFHGTQTRYGWAWLARRHGIKPGAGIARKQFRGPAELFDRLDRDRDGFLTADDFDWSDNSPYLRQGQVTDYLFFRFDGNSNGRVSRAEWEAFFKKAARGKNYLTPEDLRAALIPPPSRSSGPPPSGPTPQMLFKGLLAGELGSFREGPEIGQAAPDFNLPTHDGKSSVRLSQFRGQKPVVLVFGSFT